MTHIESLSRVRAPLSLIDLLRTATILFAVWTLNLFLAVKDKPRTWQDWVFLLVLAGGTTLIFLLLFRFLSYFNKLIRVVFIDLERNQAEIYLYNSSLGKLFKKLIAIRDRVAGEEVAERETWLKDAAQLGFFSALILAISVPLIRLILTDKSSGYAPRIVLGLIVAGLMAVAVRCLRVMFQIINTKQDARTSTSKRRAKKS